LPPPSENYAHFVHLQIVGTSPSSQDILFLAMFLIKNAAHKKCLQTLNKINDFFSGDPKASSSQNRRIMVGDVLFGIEEL